MGGGVERVCTTPQRGWDVIDKPNKGIRYGIAPYYFQAVIDDLQEKYNRNFSQQESELNEYVNIHRDDQAGVIDFTIKQTVKFENKYFESKFNLNHIHVYLNMKEGIAILNSKGLFDKYYANFLALLIFPKYFNL